MQSISNEKQALWERLAVAATQGAAAGIARAVFSWLLAHAVSAA